jgi:hypothetical protein
LVVPIIGPNPIQSVVHVDMTNGDDVLGGAELLNVGYRIILNDEKIRLDRERYITTLGPWQTELAPSLKVLDI